VSEPTHFPEQFATLEPFAAWALPTERERYDRRVACTMAELQEFYDATFPQLEAMLRYLDQLPLQDLPPDAERLLYLSLALVTVSFPVEVWRQPRVPDSGASSFDEVFAPTP
jgi:hypothetical protein